MNKTQWLQVGLMTSAIIFLITIINWTQPIITTDNSESFNGYQGYARAISRSLISVTNIQQDDRVLSSQPQPISITINDPFILNPGNDFYFYLSVPSSPNVLLSYYLMSNWTITISLYHEIDYVNKSLDNPVFQQTNVFSADFNQQLPLDNVTEGRYYLVLHNNASLNNNDTIVFNSLVLTAVAYFVQNSPYTVVTIISTSTPGITSSLSVVSSIEETSILFLPIASIFTMLIIMTTVVVTIAIIFSRNRSTTSPYRPPPSIQSSYTYQSAVHQSPIARSTPHSQQASNARSLNEKMSSKTLPLPQQNVPKKLPLSRKCPTCGGPVYHDDIFCMHCGARLI